MNFKNLLKKSLLVGAALLAGTSGAWADDWTTVWATDFSSAPSGMTYSIQEGTCEISSGYLWYKQSGTGNRSQTAVFTADAFKVNTNWKMEFDWNCGRSNANNSSVTFATNNGNAFTITWGKLNEVTTATVTNAASTSLTTTLPTAGYNISNISTWSHITITGNTENGVYLTITNGVTTYVDNQLVTATYGYPASFNGSLGKAVAAMGIDNITFATPAVAGFVAVPTGNITAPDGTNRKFTLSCLTDGATIYYATSDLAIGADGWLEYTTGEVSTDAATIYTYAKKGSDVSEKGNFATGAGTSITLNKPTFSVSSIAKNTGYYYPVVTINNNQTGLELTPASTTLTYKFNDADIASSNPYTFTEAGTLEVTVSAEGFTSNSASFEIEYPYVKTKTIDLQTIAASNLSSNWKLMAENTSLQGTWSSPYNGTNYSRYWYDVTEESASRITLVDGLEGWYQKSADANKSYYIYPGVGVVVPLTTQKDDGTENGGTKYGSNTHALYLAGGTSDQYVTWKYGNNYGKNEDKTTVTAGNASFNLYRYSDILTKVEVYSPAAPVAGTIASSGYSSLAIPYGLDFSSATASTGTLTAYAVTNITKDAVTLTSVDELPANSGVILKGTDGATYSIPVKADATYAGTNKLKAAVSATPVAANEAYILKGGQFCLVTAASTVPAGKAYLLASDVPAEARALDFAFDNETTGINTVTREIQDGEFYNLNGQRVAVPTKGLYIVNGKKVIVK